MSEANLKKALRNVINAHTTRPSNINATSIQFQNVLKRRVASIVTPEMRASHVTGSNKNNKLNGDENLRRLTLKLVDAHLNANQTRVDSISQKITDVIRKRLVRNTKRPPEFAQMMKTQLTKLTEQLKKRMQKKQIPITETSNSGTQTSTNMMESQVKKRMQKKQIPITETSNSGTQTSTNMMESQIIKLTEQLNKRIQMVPFKLIQQIQELKHPLLKTTRIQRQLKSGNLTTILQAVGALTHTNFNRRVSPEVMKKLRNIEGKLTTSKAPLAIEASNVPLAIEASNVPLAIEAPLVLKAPNVLKAPSRGQQLWRSVNTTRTRGSRLIDTAKNTANKAAAERAAAAMAAAKQRMKTLKFKNINELKTFRTSVGLPNNNENYRAALNRLQQKKSVEATKKFDNIYNNLMRIKGYAQPRSVTSVSESLIPLLGNVNQARKQKYNNVKNISKYSILMGTVSQSKINNPNVKEAYHIAKKGWNSKEHTPNHVRQLEKLQEIYNKYYNNKAVPKLGKDRGMNLLRGNKTLVREAARPIILFGNEIVRAAIYHNKANSSKKYAIPQGRYTLYQINGTTPSGKYKVTRKRLFGSNNM